MRVIDRSYVQGTVTVSVERDIEVDMDYYISPSSFHNNIPRGKVTVYNITDMDHVEPGEDDYGIDVEDMINRSIEAGIGTQDDIWVSFYYTSDMSAHTVLPLYMFVDHTILL